MIGAILGDIVGSRFEFNNHLSKEFALLTPGCEFTDDTVMTCAVAQALACFLEGESYEDVIRNCISIGGDSDTIAAIAGGIAEAFYGVPEELQSRAKAVLDPRLREICDRFEAWRNERTKG